MKTILCTALLLLAPTGWVLASTQNHVSPPVKQPLVPGKFNISTSPTQGDWQRFHILTEKERGNLWGYHLRQKMRLKDWAWQWRLGWLRTCGTKLRESYCDSILADGLQDAAMVVRAEAANQYAHAHAGTHSKKAVQLLAAAYARPDNFRSGKPLFVCEQILGALQEVGGAEALGAAKKLAAKDPHTKKYWNALNARVGGPHKL